MEARAESPARVYLHTLGCPKNDADSRTLRRSLAAAGAQVVSDPGEATHIVVNTCGFIQEAKEESIAAILDACASYPGRQVLVAGCLVERYRSELEAGIPEVAGWFGLLDGQEEVRLIRAVTGEGQVAAAARSGGRVAGAAQGPRGSETAGSQTVAPAMAEPKTAGPAGPEMAGQQMAGRAVRRSESYAYLKISDGCDEPCTFCAIPGIKGPYHSYTAAEIMREAGSCLDEGARELVLIGQDTSLWRDDGLDLSGLVELLAADQRVERIRVMYLQPDHVSDSFLAHMSRQEKLCRYLDIPFQHSHPDILRRMGRSGDGSAYLALLDRARRLMPDVVVRSAFIVGFPGEEEHHFEHLLDFVESGEFDYAGGFVYSPEEGTAAAGLKPRVKKTVARQRFNKLNAVVLQSAERRHQALVGSRLAVMVDSLDPDECGEGVAAIGRTEGQAPEVDGVTYIEGVLPEGTAVGSVLAVTITAAVGFDLVGTCDVPS